AAEANSNSMPFIAVLQSRRLCYFRRKRGARPLARLRQLATDSGPWLLPSRHVAPAVDRSVPASGVIEDRGGVIAWHRVAGDVARRFEPGRLHDFATRQLFATRLGPGCLNDALGRCPLRIDQHSKVDHETPR